jgi:Site-specific recombinase XerD
MPKRQGNGEGSIRKRKNGRWEGRYTAGADPLTGKALSRNMLGKTQSETLEKLKAAIKEAEKIDLQRAEQYTLAQWTNLWFETYSKPHVWESTALYYENYITQHIIPRLGEIPLKKLTSLQIQRFYNEVKASGRIKRNNKITDFSLSKRTVRGLHMLLHNCLEQAVRERLISVNPTDNCRIPPKERKEMKVIPPEKIGDYLKAAKEHGVLAMFYLELSSGLRRGELLALL